MSTYDSSEPRSNFGLFVFLAFMAAALIGIGSYLFQSSGSDEPAAIKPTSPEIPEMQMVAETVPKMGRSVVGGGGTSTWRQSFSVNMVPDFDDEDHLITCAAVPL